MLGFYPLATAALAALTEGGGATGSGAPTKTLSASAAGVGSNAGTGTTYFVKNGGSDAANGLSDATAWATVAKVNSFNYAPGDVVGFKRGSIWRETLAPTDNGTVDNPIVFRDYDSGALPVLAASNLAAGWANESGNLWFISLATDPNIVFFNGTRGTEKTTKATLNGANQWFWQASPARLYAWSTTDPDSAFTAPGIEYAARDTALNTNNRANNTYRNLEIRHGRGQSAGVGVVWVQNSVANITLDTLTVHDNYANGISTTGVNCTGFHMRDCEIYGCGDNGFLHNQLNMTDQHIYRNVVHHNGWRATSGSGIITRLRSGEVYENECYSNGVAGLGQGTHHGIYNPNDNTPVIYSDVKIHDNLCYDQPNGHGICCKSSAEIYNNECYGNSHGGITPNDNQTTAATFVIHHNILHHNGKNGIWQNIKGSAALHLKIYNNVFYKNNGVTPGADSAAELLMTKVVTSLDVRNNIFDTESQPAFSIVTQTSPTINYNLVRRTGSTTVASYGGVNKTFSQWQALGFDANGVNDDPDFTNPATLDFTLQGTSPAIDAGVAISGITDGFEGAAPDMGAFESGEVSDRTGSGAPTKTLSASAVGVATNTPDARTGLGTPTKTLSASAAGVATETFTGSGSPTKTLAASAVGVALQDAAVGSGALVVSLVASADGEGTATNTQDVFVGSGAPVRILAASAVGVASQKFTGSGSPTKTLSASAVGAGEQVGYDGPLPTGQTKFGGATGNRTIAWPGSALIKEDSGVEINDVAFLFIETANEVVPSVVPTPGAPGTASNFTLLSEASPAGLGTAGATDATRLTTYWCRATSHDMASVNIADPGDHLVAVMVPIRGCAPTGNPWDSITTDQTNPGSTTLTMPSGETTVDDCYILGVATNVIDTGNDNFAHDITNPDLSNVVEIIKTQLTVGNGGGICVVGGEKIEAGVFGEFTGTFDSTTRSISVSIALRPSPVPLTPATGTGAPTKTLLASAVGVGSQKFTGSGSPTKTLSVTVTANADQINSGFGAPTVTLVASAVGVATRALDIESIDAEIEVTLVATARGFAFSEGVPTEVPRPPRRAAGGGGARRKVFVVPEETKEPRVRRQKPASPPPAIEVPELPHPEPFRPSPLPAYLFDPMAWHALTTPTRAEIPIRPQWEIDEEEQFMAHLLENI